jgi:hypothetical protein
MFSNEKISTFLSLMHVLFNRMIYEWMTREKGVELFKHLMSIHSLQRPPFSIEVFSSADQRPILDFLNDSIFKFYFLYEFASKSRVELVLTIVPTVTLCPHLPNIEVEDSVNNPREIAELEMYLPKVEGVVKVETPIQVVVQEIKQRKEPETLEEAINEEMHWLKMMATHKMKVSEVELEKIIEDLK